MPNNILEAIYEELITEFQNHDAAQNYLCRLKFEDGDNRIVLISSLSEDVTYDGLQHYITTNLREKYNFCRILLKLDIDIIYCAIYSEFSKVNHSKNFLISDPKSINELKNFIRTHIIR